MRRILSLFITFHLSLFTCLSQTMTNAYQPGVTTDGAIYYLPKTAIRITLQIEKTTYTPGDFCKYADKYLRLKDVSTNPSISYRITDIRQEATFVADISKELRLSVRTVENHLAIGRREVRECLRKCM